MSAARRWTPPHPAKQIGIAADTPTSARRMKPKPPDDRCHWVECDAKLWQANPATQLCFPHAQIVERAIDAQRKAQEKARRESAEQAIADFHEGKAKTLPLAAAPGWIYFVETAGLIKIGYTANPEQRLRAYPPNATVLVCYPGTLKAEKALHDLYRDALAKGREWFHDRPEIRAHIAEQIELHGAPADYLQNRFRDGGYRREIVASRRSRRPRY